MKDSNSRLVLEAPQAELGEFIAIGENASSTDIVNLGDGLIIHYKMNDNTTSNVVVDNVSGKDAAVIAANTADYSVSGKINRALGPFSSYGDGIYYGSDIFDGIADVTDYTVSLWFYMLDENETGNSQQVIYSYYGQAIDIMFYNNGLRVLYDGTSYTTLSVPTALHWHNIILSKNGTSMKIYLDGEEAFSDTCAESVTFGAGRGESGISRSHNGTFGQFNGYVDDFRLYNKGVSLEEATGIYNENQGTESE
jgi:hypothetical protein